MADTTRGLPSVSVVIPTHNRKAKLMRLIESLQKSSYPQRLMEIIVVDDVSSDGTAEAVASRFPSVSLIRNPRELLLAGSRNAGIRRSSGDYVFLIDDDNVVDPDCVRELVSCMESDRSLGVVMPIMYLWSDRGSVWCAGVERDMLTSRTRFKNSRNCRGEGCKFTGMVESADFPNAFMLARATVANVGLLDEASFPIHYDEADYGERVRRAGYRVVCNTLARIWHDPVDPGTSLPKLVMSELRCYYTARNKIVFHRKYSAWWQFLLFMMLFNPAFAAVFLHKILANGPTAPAVRFRLAASYLRGLADGLKYAAAGR